MTFDEYYLEKLSNLLDLDKDKISIKLSPHHYEKDAKKFPRIELLENNVYGKSCDHMVGTVFIRDKTKEHNEFGSLISMFSISFMPGCCGVAVSHGSHVGEDYRQKGVGSLLHKMRKDYASILGYTILICTDRIDNNPQRKILKKNGWKDIYTFLNRRTNNELAISVCELEPKKIELI